MEMVKGSSVTIEFQAFIDDEITPADLTNALIKLYAKTMRNQTDEQALFNKTGVIVDALTGLGKVTIDAIDTNTITVDHIFVEVVCKLQTGSFVRSGAEKLEIKDNVLSTLY